MELNLPGIKQVEAIPDEDRPVSWLARRYLGAKPIGSTFTSRKLIRDCFIGHRTQALWAFLTKLHDEDYISRRYNEAHEMEYTILKDISAIKTTEVAAGVAARKLYERTEARKERRLSKLSKKATKVVKPISPPSSSFEDVLGGRSITSIAKSFLETQSIGYEFTSRSFSIECGFPSSYPAVSAFASYARKLGYFEIIEKNGLEFRYRYVKDISDLVVYSAKKTGLKRSNLGGYKSPKAKGPEASKEYARDVAVKILDAKDPWKDRLLRLIDELDIMLTQKLDSAIDLSKIATADLITELYRRDGRRDSSFVRK